VICSKCNNKMDCTQTRNYSDPDGGYNYVERRRVCTHCGYRTMTVEIPQADMYRIKAGHA
jgi:transcriptional regulator NrdR family protein